MYGLTACISLFLCMHVHVILLGATSVCYMELCMYVHILCNISVQFNCSGHTYVSCVEIHVNFLSHTYTQQELATFEPGDAVVVRNIPDEVEKLQEGHGGWNDDMAEV